MSELIFKKEKIGLGKRKQAIARVFLIPGDGNLIVNENSGNKYFQYNDTYSNIIRGPLQILNLKEKVNIIALVKGGGLTGQAFAIQLGVARQLCKMNQKNRPILKSYGFLSRDAKIKERKKYGLRKARKAPQYSKR